MDTMVFPTILANLLATGCALLLVKRGPNRRLKLLSLTVGLISLTQTAALLHSGQTCNSGSTPVVFGHQVLTGVMALVAIGLLGLEIFDRNRTERRLRLAEYVAMPPVSKNGHGTGQHPAIADLADLRKLPAR